MNFNITFLTVIIFINSIFCFCFNIDSEISLISEHCLNTCFTLAISYEILSVIFLSCIDANLISTHIVRLNVSVRNNKEAKHLLLSIFIIVSFLLCNMIIANNILKLLNIILNYRSFSMIINSDLSFSIIISMFVTQCVNLFSDFDCSEMRKFAKKITIRVIESVIIKSNHDIKMLVKFKTLDSSRI